MIIHIMSIIFTASLQIVLLFFVESASSRSSDEEQGESSYSTRYYLRKRQTDYGSSNDENQSKRRRKLSSKSSSCKGTYWLVQCLLKTKVELDKNLICQFELEKFLPAIFAYCSNIFIKRQFVVIIQVNRQFT